MDNYLLIYLWTKLYVFDVLFFIFILLAIFTYSTYLFELYDVDKVWYKSNFNLPDARELVKKINEDVRKKYKSSKKVKLIITGLIITGIMSIAIPDKKDALVIYLMPKVYNSKGIQESIDLLNNLPEEIRLYIRKYIKTE